MASTSASRSVPSSAEHPARGLAALAVEAMQSKKAVDITVIDVREVSGVTDYFVIGTGESSLQVKAIADAVREQLKEAGERPWKREGTQHNQWVVLDYVNVVAHVFDRERRAYYDLERLWGDAPIEHVADDAETVALLEGEG
ncbi:MAG: ribosome silencing factor [Bacteroidota bacterium]